MKAYEVANLTSDERKAAEAYYIEHGDNGVPWTDMPYKGRTQCYAGTTPATASAIDSPEYDAKIRKDMGIKPEETKLPTICSASSSRPDSIRGVGGSCFTGVSKNRAGGVSLIFDRVGHVHFCTG